MAGAAGHMEIPVIISIAVAAVVVIWLVHFIAGIRRTSRFYRQKTEADRNAGSPADLSETDSCEDKNGSDNEDKKRISTN